jgi:predicted enzyme related to lactoylglutathione lyase
VITAAHFLIYSTRPEADRAFIRDVLGFRSVDVGGGWLIFALPPAEIAVHPSSGGFVQRHGDDDMLGMILYLMCDDVHATIRTLTAQGVTCGTVDRADWGLATTIQLPSGGRIGLYQPLHPSPLDRA